MTPSIAMAGKSFKRILLSRARSAAFDDMADKLANREEELRIANQHLEELPALTA